jgi:hypothetical protein
MAIERNVSRRQDGQGAEDIVAEVWTGGADKRRTNQRGDHESRH